MALEPIKEVMTEGLRDPKFGYSPGHGLPRPWKFYKDPGLYLTIAVLCAWAVLFRAWVVLPSIVSAPLADGHATAAEMGIVAAVLIVAAFHPLLALWVAWDSYRWDYPHRLVYVCLISMLSLLVFLFYLHARSGWVMEAQRQARMHRLGLHDD